MTRRPLTRVRDSSITAPRMDLLNSRSVGRYLVLDLTPERHLTPSSQTIMNCGAKYVKEKGLEIDVGEHLGWK